ncbi:MAG: histidine phosphatase family protein [Acidobacteria bacterium]|nr:histidine phosphatase family protein [Acidobacteriota bacterium]MCB9398110.1 histidine phosphatase family protein [Acidobacteriota bacterium]
MNQLWLVRHGQSEGNRNHCFLGRQDPPLTDLGRKQMQSIRALLPNQPDQIWTSPLQRASQSAALLFSQHAQTDSRLMEQDFGAWEGLTREEAEQQDPHVFAAWATGDPVFAPPKGESLFSVQARVESWLADFQKKGSPQAVVVAHGGLLQTLCCRLLNTPLSNQWPYVFQQGGIAHFRFLGSRAQMIGFYPGPLSEVSPSNQSK